MERSSISVLNKDITSNINLLEIHDNHFNNYIPFVDKFDQNKKFEIPKALKKSFYCSLSLLVLGIILIILGLIKIINSESFTEGLPFGILSFVLLIPGIFYTYQFLKAKYTKDVDLRLEIFSEIPEL